MRWLWRAPCRSRRARPPCTSSPPSSKARRCSRWGRCEAARAAAKKAADLLEASLRELGSAGGRYLEIFARPYVDQLETELALRSADPAAAEAAILKVADELSRNPRFDAWGEGLFRLERIALDARRAGRPQLAADIEVRMKKIDPAYMPGSAVPARQAARCSPGRVHFRAKARTLSLR